MLALPKEPCAKTVFNVCVPYFERCSRISYSLPMPSSYGSYVISYSPQRLPPLFPWIGFMKSAVKSFANPVFLTDFPTHHIVMFRHGVWCKWPKQLQNPGIFVSFYIYVPIADRGDSYNRFQNRHFTPLNSCAYHILARTTVNPVLTITASLWIAKTRL